MKDKLTPSMIKRAIRILEEHKITGDYEVRVNIIHFQELVHEMFKMIKKTIMGCCDRDMPITMIIDQLNILEKQIQENLSKKE